MEEYLIENTKIKICDDYFINKTEEEIRDIIQKCAEIAFRG